MTAKQPTIKFRPLRAAFAFLLSIIFLAAIAPSTLRAAPGDLDTTFGAGKVFTSFGAGDDSITSTAVQADGKIVVAGAYYTGVSYDVAVARYNADGSLDATFGSGGKFTYAVSGPSSDGAAGVAIDANGKIVLTGFYISGAGNYNTFVMRLNGNGALDNTFGGTGLVQTDISGGARNNRGFAVAVQPDGKIVVAGMSNNASTGNNFAVVRYTSTGAVDFIRLFDVSLIGGVDEANCVVVQPDGKIVAGGYAYTNSGGSGYDFALLRLNADGTVDSSYSGGVVLTNFNAQSDYIYSLALQPDGKLIAAGIGSDSVRGNFALARYNTNGALDTTFGSGGKVTTNFNNSQSGINGIKIQPDDKIVAVGYNSNGTNNDFALARYNANGTLDNSFDGDGKVVTVLSAFNNLAYAVALQSDGKIIAAGSGKNNNNTNDDFAVARFNANGSLDGAFAPGGKVTTSIQTSYNDQIYAAKLQPDGKIVVAGNFYVGTDRSCILARYNADGTLDRTFGAGGRVTRNFVVNTFDEGFFDLAVQTDGKIVAVGYFRNGSQFDFVTARYNSDGTPDTPFNGGLGYVLKDFASSSDDYAYAVAVQTDGRIVVAGESGNGSLRNSAFVSYNANGSIDTNFGGGDGDLVVPVSNVDSDSINKIVIQPDRKIVAVGYAYPVLGGISHFSVVRLTEFGALDNSFDSNGMLTTQIGAGTSSAGAVALQSDGKIVVAGYSQNGVNNNLAVARYNGSDGALDTSFDTDGYLTTVVSGVQSYGRAVAVQADGKIVVAGQTAGAGNADDFLLARYNTNGALDTSFDSDGLVIKDINGFSDAANGLVVQPDGKIIAAGQSNNGSNNDFALARFLPGASCTYSISPASVDFSATAATGSVTVTTNESYCTWTAASNAGWLGVTGGASGTGGGAVSYAVQANAGAARTGTLTIAGQTFTVNQAAAVDVSMPTNVQSLKNGVVLLPINVSDATGKGILSYDFRIGYDASVLTPLSPAIEATGTVSSDFNFNVNANTAGQILVSGYGTQPLAGAGAMLYLRFAATGAAPACSAVNFAAFQFNDGSPAANTANGQVCIINGSVSGAVTNVNTAASSAVPNVTLTASGNSTFSTATDSNGNYLLEGFGNGTYTVTPSKSGDVGGAIASFDAALISRYAVQLETLNANQLLAADVSSSNTVNSYDAALISQYLVGIANPGSAGTWKFTPASRTFTDLTANQPNQNYAAVLMGDVSGNWTAPTPFAEALKAEAKPLESAIAVGLPNVFGGVNQTINVPVSVGDVTGRGFYAFDTEIRFDPAILRLDAVLPVEKSGTLSADLATTANANLTGKLLLSAYGANALAGSGTLFNLRFRVVGAAGQVSPLTFERFVFNEDAAQSVTTGGRVTVLAPTTANVALGGRVATADGRGIRGVDVILTDADGVSRRAVTGSFGNYRFEGLRAGAVYTVTVQSKKYAFDQPTRVVEVADEIADLDFTAQQ